MSEALGPGGQTALAKALSHPLRQRLLFEYGRRTASPSELSELIGEPLNKVSYHTRRLLECGCLEFVREEFRRGGLQHFYRATVSYEFERDAFAALPAAARATVAVPVIETLVAELAAAAAGGALAAPDLHVSRMPLTLDQRGFDELSAQLRELVELARRIEAESVARAPADGPPRRSILALLHFDAPG